MVSYEVPMIMSPLGFAISIMFANLHMKLLSNIRLCHYNYRIIHYNFRII